MRGSVRLFLRPGQVCRRSIEFRRFVSGRTHGCKETAWLSGTVQQIASYGVWVDVCSPGYGRGLIHLTEGANLALRVGTPVQVRVKGVDDHGNLHLSAKANTREEAIVDVSQDSCLSARSVSTQSGKPSEPSKRVGVFRESSITFACDWFRGTVRCSTRSGVAVDVHRHGHLEKGFVPSSCIDSCDPAVFAPGQAVDVRIIGKSSGELSLSMKGGAAAIQADLESQLEALRYGYTSDNAQDNPQGCVWLTGTVEEVMAFGLRVAIVVAGRATHGLLYTTELDDYVDEPAAVFAIGDPVQVRIIGNGAAGLLLSSKTGAAEIDLDVMAHNACDANEFHCSDTEEVGRSPLDANAFQVKDVDRDGIALSAFLDVPPSTWLRAVVDREATEFAGTNFLEVKHPGSSFTARGVVRAEEMHRIGSGPVRVRILHVDMHRRWLVVTTEPP